MSFRLTMPQLGLAMQSGNIVEWYKNDGDMLKPGDPVFAVETDKAVQDFEAPVGGKFRIIPEIRNQSLPVSVPVDSMIGYILGEGEEMPGAEASSGAQEEKQPVGAAAVVAEAAPAVEQTSRRIKASPLARRLAERAGLDLATIAPGERGKIQARDVEVAIAAKQAAAPVAMPTPVAPKAAPISAPLAGQAVPMTQVRRVIAQRMAESAQTTAAVTEVTEADATKLVEFREQAKASLQAEGQPVPSYTDLIIKLVALALHEHPALNATLAGDEIIQMNDVHIAVAVDSEEGLRVPVVRDALHKSVYEISLETKALAEKVRTRKISPDDLQGGTFTITNLGNYGIDAFTPIINLPQCAILGVGRIISKPAEWQGQIALRKMVTLSLTFDHRIVDGGPAARFLNRVRQYVEDPHLWLIR
ncbi:MAG: dihydrolipoamide acetyltransferase family protein [Chloroflexota bacterium]